MLDVHFVFGSRVFHRSSANNNNPHFNCFELAMAPMKKVTKVMKAMLKPAATPLTEQNVKKHLAIMNAGADNEEDALAQFNKLDPKSKQSLWKAFELQRKSTGFDDQYNEETGKGAGSTIKKMKLMAGFIMDKGNIGNNYKQFMQKISVTKSKSYEAEWISLEKALRSWGKKELFERVKSGSILMRKNPKDPRFPEFKEESVKEKINVDNVREYAMGGSGSSSVNELMSFFNRDNDDMGWEDFAMVKGDENEPQGGDAELQKMLGFGVKNKAGGSSGHKDPPGAFDIAKLETMSTIGNDDGVEKLVQKFVGMKKAVQKMELSLQGVPADKLDAKGSKKIHVLLQGLGKSLTALNNAINTKDKVTKTSAKSVLFAALGVMKNSKDFINGLK